ncbi:MAG: ribonuclease P protein component [Firmicutes bacterium]|nr:ribonuclease P protein component [Bacillota bacterium]
MMKEKDVLKEKERSQKVQRIERLRKNYQFQKIYRQGRSVATAKTVLYFKKSRIGSCRAGIVVSKKVGKSVVRHRLKRLYREALHSLRKYLKAGYDLVIIARKGADKLTYWDVLADLRKLLVKGKLLW